MELFGLADCNNFFCSCERVFRPDLWDKPCVVLSNNDGIVVALSNEAKALGIKRGSVFFQIKDIIEDHHVAVFSSNYSLYGDMSKRIMSILSTYTPHIDVYSIDEAFLDLSNMYNVDLNKYGQEMVSFIKRGIGIPISLGIAPTKTLAKIASKFAKKYKGYKGCCIIDTEEKIEKALRMMDVEDVWGIGRRYSKKLKAAGIITAWDFSQKQEAWVQREMTIVGVKTWRELRGESCISIEELPHKKSICTSRSFPDRGLSNLQDLEAAISNFTSQCSRKLREQHTACNLLTIYAVTSRFNPNTPNHSIYSNIALPVATNDRLELIKYAMAALRQQWKGDGKYYYKSAGVIVNNIVSSNAIQSNIFDTVDREKQERLSKAIDYVNRKNGYNTVRSGVEGFEKNWKCKTEFLSKQFTTNIKDIITVKV